MQKEMNSLTDHGKARRLRKLALNALEQYDLEVTDVRLVGVYTNTLFRLRTACGSSFIIRICKPGWRTTTDLRSEAMWLHALHRDTDIGAPEPIPARNGDYIVLASSEGVPEPRRCFVMSWISGGLLGSRLTEANLYKMGVLFARLHAHTAAFSPSDGFTQRRMDNIFARGDPAVLFGDASRDAFTPHSRAILEKTMARVREAFERLYADPTGLRVIHNDLHHDNIKIHHGRLRPFDFEDTIWGYPLQDIAMALQDLMIEVKPEAFTPLRRAFREGYESRCMWPESYEGQIDTFRTGRMLWVANYVARFERKYLRAPRMAGGTIRNVSGNRSVEQIMNPFDWAAGSRRRVAQGHRGPTAVDIQISLTQAGFRLLSIIVCARSGRSERPALRTSLFPAGERALFVAFGIAAQAARRVIIRHSTTHQRRKEAHGNRKPRARVDRGTRVNTDHRCPRAFARRAFSDSHGN